ncbi:MAG: hypothetical protein ACD_4C00388G0001 [uncultured bacterium (gcode 4)]|uniref:Uncharacterized protein n=1 Tax=uncultured bacterium (gcode 4) TaxID=1234023 RepID=K2F557_9BACT|nr:MAG: hypothetical protein ACD_4C00388G0001 [uncultured bacterium (gcode 4)]
MKLITINMSPLDKQINDIPPTSPWIQWKSIIDDAAIARRIATIYNCDLIDFEPKNIEQSNIPETMKSLIWFPKVNIIKQISDYILASYNWQIYEIVKNSWVELHADAIRIVTDSDCVYKENLANVFKEILLFRLIRTDFYKHFVENEIELNENVNHEEILYAVKYLPEICYKPYFDFIKKYLFENNLKNSSLKEIITYWKLNEII